MSEDSQKPNKVSDFLGSPDEKLHTEADYAERAKGDNYGISKEFKVCVEKNIKYIVWLAIVLIAVLAITLLFLLIRYVCIIYDNENAIGEVISKILSYIGGIASAIAVKAVKNKSK